MDSPDPRAVLILDDELEIVNVLRDTLTKFNYRAITATNWTDALQALERSQPDLLLLDLNMPTIDGEAILRFLREQGHKIPVIVVSGFINEEVEQTLSQYDVDRFMHKPVQIRDLAEEIERVLSPTRGASRLSDSSLSNRDPASNLGQEFPTPEPQLEVGDSSDESPLTEPPPIADATPTEENVNSEEPTTEEEAPQIESLQDRKTHSPAEETADLEKPDPSSLDSQTSARSSFSTQAPDTPAVTLQPSARQRRTRSGNRRRKRTGILTYLLYASLFALFGLLMAFFLNLMEENESLLDEHGPMVPAREAAP